MTTHDKLNRLQRVLAGLAATGVERVISMADQAGIMDGLGRLAERASAGGWPALEFVDQHIAQTGADTTAATRASSSTRELRLDRRPRGATGPTGSWRPHRRMSRWSRIVDRNQQRLPATGGTDRRRAGGGARRHQPAYPSGWHLPSEEAHRPLRRSCRRSPGRRRHHRHRRCRRRCAVGFDVGIGAVHCVSLRPTPSD